MALPILAEQIADRLRHAILLGKLAPGADVSERETATAMGISRTPMREAIRILAKEGLLVLRPSHSPQVADPSLQQVEDDLEIVQPLEALSAELACKNATKEEVDEIRELHGKMVGLSGPRDRLEFFETDMAFHRAIARASHNPSLDEVHGQFLARLWRVRFLSAMQDWDRARVLRQHALIVAGLEARDAEQVKRETYSHIHHIKQNIQEFFRKEKPQHN